MRKISYIVVILLTYFCISANFSKDVNVMAQGVPRLIISIYKYSGIHTKKQENEFDAFKEIIQAKILKLSQEIGSEGTSLDYVSGLMPSLVSDLKSNENLPFTGSRKDLYDYWYSSGALEVLLGRIRSTGSTFSVRSEVFLGDLKGDLKKDSVTLDLPISDEQFDTTRDSHTIVTLYALAMDAKKRNRPGNEVLAFLSEANARLPDLPAEMPGVLELKKAIETTIKQIRNQNKVGQQ